MPDSQTILITGTSSGFGRDTGLAAAERGHTVFATMRDVTGKNAEVAGALRTEATENGWDLHVVEMDVADEASVDAAVKEVISAAGAPDVVIHNAGRGAFGPSECFTPEQLLQLFDVNVFGAVRLNRAVLPRMRARGSGYLVYVTSIVGRIVSPFMAPYVSSKFALEGFAQSTAYELEPEGIETTIVEPGAFATDVASKVMRPDDVGRFETYGPGRAMFDAMVAGYRGLEAAEPKVVVDALIELIESEPGTRPLRRPVGMDAVGACTPINAAHDAVQQALRERAQAGTG